MSETDLTVGTRVRVLDGFVLCGRAGVIEEIDAAELAAPRWPALGPFPYVVRLDDGSVGRWAGAELAMEDGRDN